MAKRVVVEVICDKCGGIFREEETVSYTIQGPGLDVETDLCLQDAEALRVNFLVGSRPIPKAKKSRIKPEQEAPYPVMQPATTKSKSNYSGRPRTVECDQPGCVYVGPDARSIGVHKAKYHNIKSGRA